MNCSLTRRVLDRQAAVLYLHAAGMASNVMDREELRRRAVRLLSSGGGTACGSRQANTGSTGMERDPHGARP